MRRSYVHYLRNIHILSDKIIISDILEYAFPHFLKYPDSATRYYCTRYYMILNEIKLEDQV